MSEETRTCQNCSSVAEEGYEYLLCPKCRNSFSRRPLPLGIKVSTAVILLILLFALTRFPGVLKGGVAFEKGLRAEKIGNYPRAITQYSRAWLQFRKSTLVTTRTAIAYYRAGQRENALTYFTLLLGREMPKELVEEVNQILQEIKEGK